MPLQPEPQPQPQQQTAERTPNLNPEIVIQIAKKIGLIFVNEPTGSTHAVETRHALSLQPEPHHQQQTEFAPIDILDYIYAVLHSPTYRQKYKEFLKIDFPRVPYPKDAASFWQLVKLGGEIRQIHLLESPTVEKYITQYPIDGDNVVTKQVFVISQQHNTKHPTQKNAEHSPPPEGCPTGGVVNTHPQNQLVGKVFINETQYFDNVPQTAWNFYIGSYQPAQKWLKDRKTRTLEFEDILHYQKIIVALTETDRLMKEIDKIEIE